MKYIRTKDKKGKQYIVSDRDYIFLIRDSKVIYACGYEEELLKQADTIEELCDEFVEYGNRPIVITQANVKKGRMSGKTPVILGAIWTDKGLIFVARMNSEGVLELL